MTWQWKSLSLRNTGDWKWFIVQLIMCADIHNCLWNTSRDQNQAQERNITTIRIGMAYTWVELLKYIFWLLSKKVNPYNTLWTPPDCTYNNNRMSLYKILTLCVFVVKRIFTIAIGYARLTRWKCDSAGTHSRSSERKWHHSQPNKQSA